MRRTSKFLIFACASFALFYSQFEAHASDENSCRSHLDDLVGRCALDAQKGSQPGDISYFITCRNKHKPDYDRCMSNGIMTSASTTPPAGCREARINIDWVFENAGARNKFWHARNGGKSAYDAVLDAQSHNNQAQRTIRDCQNWVRTYLASKNDAQVDRPELSNHQLSSQDCKCFSVVPTNDFDAGGRRKFQVSNSCNAVYEVGVSFAETIPTGGQRSTGQVGLMRGGAVSSIWAPSFKLTSVDSVSLRNATSYFACHFR